MGEPRLGLMKRRIGNLKEFRIIVSSAQCPNRQFKRSMMSGAYWCYEVKGICSPENCNKTFQSSQSDAPPSSSSESGSSRLEADGQGLSPEEKKRRAKAFIEIVESIVDDPDFEEKVRRMPDNVFTWSESELKRRFTI